MIEEVTATSVQLTSIDLSQLQTIGDHIEIHDNGSLTSIDLPQLETIGGLIAIFVNFNLTSIDLPQLQTIGENVDINDNDIADCDLGSYSNQYCP